jgi:hypothetical protein
LGADEVEMENQIDLDREVEHGEAVQNPITPALERTGGGEEKMAAQQSLVVAREDGGGVECVRVRGMGKREGSGQGLAWLDQVESVGPSWSGPGLGQTSWANPSNHLNI